MTYQIKLTALGAYHLGNEIRFADIDLDDWCISPESAKKLIDKNTKAIIAVNLYGNIAKFNQLKKLNVPIIEDAAESLGSKLDNKISGSFGIASAFSFHRTKTITTGEGGMLVTDDEKIYKKCKMLRDLGREPGTYYNEIIGYKYMPFNVQAAIGLAQLHRINELIEIKRSILNKYKHNILNVQFNNDNLSPVTNNLFELGQTATAYESIYLEEQGFIAGQANEFWVNDDSLFYHDGASVYFNKGTARSDLKYKRDVTQIDGALGKVQQLRGIEFNWKDEEKFGGQREIGLIAQEVAEVVPELTSRSRGDMYVNYDRTVALLIEAIKEQQRQIDELKMRLK